MVDSAPGVSAPVAAIGSSAADAVDDRVCKPLGAGDRPENPRKPSEKIDSAPGVSAPVAAIGSSAADAVDDRACKPLGAGGRPENPAQDPEKIDSAPGSRPLSTSRPGRA